MFGPSYFAPPYFGPSYFGAGADAVPVEAAHPCGSYIADQLNRAIVDEVGRIIIDYPLCEHPAQVGGTAIPYRRPRMGRGRRLRDICDEVERECGFKIDEPAIILPPEVPLDFEWMGRQLDELRKATAELEAEAKARDQDEDDVMLISHARRLQRRLEEDEEAATLLLLWH